MTTTKTDGLRTALITHTLAVARAEIGVEEAPPHRNTGRRVEEYQRRAGYSFPVPWCLAFAYFCVDEAAQVLRNENRLLRTGDCDTLAVWARKMGVLHDEPQPGDIGLLYKVKPSGGARDYHHAWIAEKVAAASKSITTIEGNTNAGGSREGYAVLRRTRTLSRMMFVRYAALYPAEAHTGGVVVSAPPLWPLYGPDGVEVARMPLAGAQRLAPIRNTLLALGVPAEGIVWDAEDQLVRVASGGKTGEVGPVTLIDGSAWAPVREVAAAVPGIAVDAQAASVRLRRVASTSP